MTEQGRPAVDDAVRQWQETGLALLDRLLPAAEVATGLDELLAADIPQPSGPTRRAEEAVRRRRDDLADDDDVGPAFRGRQFEGTTLFPLPGCPTLNRLFVHPDLVGFAKAALGTDDIRIYQSRIWSKYGDYTNYEQPMHRDGNHALVPIANEPPWWHLECFVYLNDVGLDNGAPGVVPGEISRADLSDRAPVGAADRPDLYAAEVRGVGGPGSVLAYRSDVWHRGRDLAPGEERHIIVIAFRPAEAEWIGFDSHAPLVNSPDFRIFAQGCTPDELALFGVPRPGHPYWTGELLDAMAGVYPELDLDPWRDALG